MTQTAAPPRIAPLEPPYEPEMEQMLRKWMPPGSPLEPLKLFRTLGVHEELFSRMRPLGAGILGHGRVGPRDRELIIDRTCARAGAEYEWGVHATAYGEAVGLTAGQLAATATGSPEDSAFEDEDALLITLADELYDTGTVTDLTWAALAERYSADQLLELVIIAGWYRLLSSVINTVRIEPETWAARFPN
jgi:alkylhydroperoxidase family enzyme